VAAAASHFILLSSFSIPPDKSGGIRGKRYCRVVGFDFHYSRGIAFIIRQVKHPQVKMFLIKKIKRSGKIVYEIF